MDRRFYRTMDAQGVDDDDRSSLERFGVTEFHVILNFFEELKQRMGN